MLIYYIFASLCCAGALGVVTAANPVHSVLFLILTFINAAGLFVLIGAEFLAMIVLIVYIGAIAVLFLFVVMMVDIAGEKSRGRIVVYLPLGMLIAAVGIIEMVVVLGVWQSAPAQSMQISAPIDPNLPNSQAIGNLLYTRYFYYFQSAGVILLIAMIGAILLTLRHRDGVKRQDMGAQATRQRSDSVRMVDVKSGQGL